MSAALFNPCLSIQIVHRVTDELVVSGSVKSDSVIPWAVACWAPLSMGFSRQEYWSGFPFPSPGHLSNPGIKPGSPVL